MTSPTARPLVPGAAKLAAMGTSTWAATENNPVISVPRASSAKLWLGPLSPDSAMPVAASTIRLSTRRRRSSMSPRGTSSSRPKAYDTWASVTMLAAWPSCTPSSWAMECSSGWLK